MLDFLKEWMKLNRTKTREEGKLYNRVEPIGEIAIKIPEVDKRDRFAIQICIKISRNKEKKKKPISFLWSFSLV